ncbi:MAG: UDP-N-acetylmuramoylalanine--D-glutamate ligase [Candidatus Blackburnbacteria bacterium RIFCSPHIGHO2_12_FULL_41_13b]|uniref:UDP-N-acetylmuramoylalanine--D-glutamate ligase n=1 Tax=Candidatus Blackburnbacteria bacterium RIFCSPHIGHO2_12_FULL_41_13b TaxID=1797517 RepID=A0A1G1VAC9_9BACT|nr:MAG: UDP-N-acetylmuramoylalanine--D-glutamate ligase [Candidatus Blackburnbacteria bacterium RIFCSPHIGHO2_12_FULL_41_13b]
MRVAILGFGIEGKDAVKYFLSKEKETQITVFDIKSREELGIELWITEQGDALNSIKWVLGEGYLDSGLKDFDLIVRSPGFRPDLPQIQETVKKGSKLTSTTNIFFDECKTQIIAVTGTKGKGTTASLITEGLKACGKKVTLLGNIGEPMLASLSQANQSDYVVLELSSFQTIDLTKSPHIAVVTNITSDHMDWHTSQEEYEKAKEQLWANQTKKDFLVLNRTDKTSVKIANRAPGTLVWYTDSYSPGYTAYISDKDWKMHEPEFEIEVHNKVVVEEKVIGETSEVKLPGHHNILNILATLCVISVLNVDVNKAWTGIISFEGLEHRLEKVREINGILYVNDSYATNPEPTLAAIKSFDQPKVLILGGSSKGAGFAKMAGGITKSNIRGVVLIGDEAKNIENSLTLAGFRGEIWSGGRTMVDIVLTAKSMAQPGDVVLLSPACASFGLFENYKDRGKQFKEAVLQLKTGY